jgi:hypothetical protein
MPHEFSHDGMMAPEVGPGTGLESAANPSELACGVQRNSNASSYMQVNWTHLILRCLSLVTVDGDNKSRGQKSDDKQAQFCHSMASSV